MMAIASAIRKPGLPVRESRVRKSRSVAGSGLVSTSDRCGAGGGFCVVDSMLLVAFQISFDPFFRISDRARQFYFCQVMRIEALNITLVRASHGLLCLDHLQIVRHTRAKTILRLRQSLFGQIDRAAGDFHLLSRSV